MRTAGGQEVKRSLFYDEHEDAESEYTPSAASSSSSSSSEDGESDAEIVSAEELMQDDGVGPLDEHDNVAFEPQDMRYWSCIKEKKAWIAQFREADRRYVKQFGARLTTSGDPKAKKKLRREKQWQPVYRLVLTLLVVAYLVTILYRKKPLSVSLSYRNGTNQQPLENRNQSDSAGVRIEHLDIQAPAIDDGSGLPLDTDYVHTGLALCSKLLFRLVNLDHDPSVKRSAVEACDAVVVLAGRGSLQSAKAHVLRGDLRSLESEFDAADQDYEQAEAAVKRSLVQTALLENVQHKRLVNRWIQLYATKTLYKLQKECKDVVLASDAAPLARQLAERWLQVLQRQKKLLDVLTDSRLATLQRLVYE